MEKLDYITRQLSRTEKKRFEHYVITRVWHLLNDLTIKFVTQQYITRPNGRALTDMFFPQLKIHIEVDEGHHKHQIQLDKIREADIINATDHEILRVDVTQSISAINDKIDKIVEYLRNVKAQVKDFRAWDILAEQNPQTYIDQGYISIDNDVAFHRIIDAANCFGHKYKGCQRAGVKHPYEENKIIWFPKLYENREWKNKISDDEHLITEKSNIPEKVKGHIDFHISSPIKNRIVFARVKSPLGDIMYRFKGEYKLNIESSNYIKGLVWEKIADKVKTYKAK